MTPHQRWTQTALTELRVRVGGGEQLDQLVDTLDRPMADIQAMMTRLRLRIRAD